MISDRLEIIITVAAAIIILMWELFSIPIYAKIGFDIIAERIIAIITAKSNLITYRIIMSRRLAPIHI